MDHKLIEEYLSGITDAPSAAPVIKEWALAILKRYKDTSVPLKLIKELIIEETGFKFSPGSYSGAMRDLVDESRGRIINTDRGYYMYVSNTKGYAINAILDETIKKLDNLAYDNILSLTEEDKKTIEEIPGIIEKIKTLKKDV